MIAINLDRVSVRYITDSIFDNLSWDIHDDRCVGLVGPNGCGKSTLLKLIAEELKSDTGFVVRQKGLTIGYLRQEPVLTPGHTVLQETLSASTDLAEIENELVRAEEKLTDPTVYGNDRKLQRTLERQARLLEAFEKLGGPGNEGRVRAILRSLGFGDADFDLPMEALSGGQKKLVGLAKLLVVQPDLLLLDEPDNHLDLAGKRFLEEFIRSYRGGVVIVSHDRYLLDVVADEIVELEDGRLTRYHGNYSEFAFEKQQGLLRQQHNYQIQQKEISRLEQAANRLLTWGRGHDNEKLIKRGKAILKRVEKIDRLDKPVMERKKMGLELKGWRGSNKVLEISGLDKVFPAVGSGPTSGSGAASAAGENIVLAGLNLLVWHGERVGLVGPNGAGKSVLFRLILGKETPTSGEIKIGPSVVVGYYAQQHETLDYERTLIDTIRRTGEMNESTAVSILGRFMFNYQQARGPVANLSGGERSRLQMALLMLSGANFLLLDEPTNNLDIPSAEVLEDALAEFEGAALVISHDRYFLDRVIERIVELDEGSLTEFLGNYSDYQSTKSEQGFIRTGL